MTTTEFTKPIQPQKPVDFENQPEVLQDLYWQFYDEYMEQLREWNELNYDSQEEEEIEVPSYIQSTIDTIVEKIDNAMDTVHLPQFPKFAYNRYVHTLEW